jgi:hypothetical protein
LHPAPGDFTTGLVSIPVFGSIEYPISTPLST